MQTPSFKGQKSLQTQSNEYNSLVFTIRQELSKLNTTTVVKVESVNVESRISPVGYVDVRPQIDQMDGNNNPVSHGVIYNVPYMRLQGGRNAVIIDPQVGDIGICCFSDRDISRFKEQKEPSLPGTKRMMSMADGLYIGGVMNEPPERYVIIEDSGIEINGDDLIYLTAETVNVESAEVNITADSINLEAETNIMMAAPSIDIIADTNINMQAPTISITANTALNLISSTAINLLSAVISAATGTMTAADFSTSVIASLNVHGHAPGSFTGYNSTPISGKSGVPS